MAVVGNHGMCPIGTLIKNKRNEEIILFIFFAVCVICLASSSKGEIRHDIFYQDTLNFPDSLVVDSICDRATLCQRLNFVEKNLSIFCRRGGYHQRILGSIAKEAKVQIEIPISNGGSLLSHEQSQGSLLIQVNSIRRKYLCPALPRLAVVLRIAYKSENSSPD